MSEKYKVITRLSQKGMDPQDIAAIVDLDPVEVQKVVNATPNT